MKRGSPCAPAEPAPAPRLSGARSQHVVGEQAELRVKFPRGSARLVVEPGGGQAPQTPELALNVQYRDRFTPLGHFAACGHRTVQRRFERIGSLSSGRSEATAVQLADGRVLVAGGHSMSEGAYVFTELFDPASGHFSPLPAPGLAPRAAHSAWRATDGFMSRTLCTLGSTAPAQPHELDAALDRTCSRGTRASAQQGRVGLGFKRRGAGTTGIRLGGSVLAMKACTALGMAPHRSRPWRSQVSWTVKPRARN